MELERKVAVTMRRCVPLLPALRKDRRRLRLSQREEAQAGELPPRVALPSVLPRAEVHMRRVVTGVGDDGRSVVVADGAPPTAFHADETSPLTRVDSPSTGPVPAHEAVVHELWSIGTDPGKGTKDPTIGLEEIVFDAPVGGTKWIVTEMGPHLFTSMHHTPTIDYGFVVRGELELGLEAGSVVLRAGDAVLVDGVKHSWLAGPDGCVIATVLVGLRDADRS
jgi:hypothetical protein